MLESGALNETLEALKSQIKSAKTNTQYFDQVQKIFEIYDVGHGCLHSLHHSDLTARTLWKVIPQDVSDACGYLVDMGNHPALRLGENRHFPFDLFDFRQHFKDDPDVEALYCAFENNAVHHAYGLPIQTVDLGTFVFVVARPGSTIDTVELLTLQAICSNAVNGVKQFVRRPCDAVRTHKLSGSQRQLLLDIAGGSGIGEVSRRTGLSELTIKAQLDHAVEKLGGRNVSHAIVLAMIEGEFGLEDVV